MNRHLQKLNLFGVLLLAALCVTQWKINRDANLQLQQAQKIQREQMARISDQEKTIEGNVSDLEAFRTQLTATKAAEKDLEKKLTASEHETRQLTVEAAALKSAITNWAAALETRDQQLRQASTNLQSLIESRDQAIEKYNDLARRQNDLVAEINRSRTNAIANSRPTP